MPTRITPYLLYEDAAAAIDFLTRAFGFTERLRFTDDGGAVTHAELELGDAEIYLGQPGPDFKSPKRLGQTTVGIHVYVADVDAHYRQAKAAGAEITLEPADQEYGDRRYDCRDPEGHQWYFAQRLEGATPA